MFKKAVIAGISPFKKRKCTACGEKESGRVVLRGLGEQTFVRVEVIDMDRRQGDKEIPTGQTLALQPYVCMVCGHVDFYGEAIPPSSKPSGGE